MTAAAPITRGRLAAITAWRLAVAACGFIGFGAAVAIMDDPWPALSQQASLLTGVVYLGLAAYPLCTGGQAHEPASPWLRGALAVLLLLVSGTYLTVLGGDLDATWSLFEHLVTPLVVLIDWVAVGRNQAATRWWYPLTWVAFPFAYLVYFLAADVRLYHGILDPADGGFPATVAGFTVAVVATGFGLYGVARLRAVQP